MIDSDDLAPAFDVRWGSASHTGHHREENQDSLLARPPLFLVADGMGGHRRGRDASELVIQAFDEAATESWLTPAALCQGATMATESVHQLSQSAEGAPGSTVTGVGLANHEGRPCWLVFNVGDSRTYRLTGGVLEQITVDHSPYQELLDSGLNSVEASAQVSVHVITRAIGGGVRQVPRVDQWLLSAAAGDRMLICSDGLTGELTDQLISAILLTYPNPTEAAGQLVDAAVHAGGRDNVTAVVVDAIEVRGAVPLASGLEGDTLTDFIVPSIVGFGGKHRRVEDPA